MRRAALALAVLLVVACTPAAEAPAPETTADAPLAPPPVVPEPTTPVAIDPTVAWENRLGNLPPDAAEVIERVEACTHFSGEFNGDRSERDREVAAKMTELHCETIEADSIALRGMYGDRPDVLEALAMATEGVR